MWKTFAGIGMLIGLLACGSSKDSVDQTATCADLGSQKERNVCWHDALLRQNPSDSAQAYKIAGQIGDQVIRGAAISKWVQTHNRKIEPAEGKKLCDLLKDREKTSCVRKLYAAHLQR